MAYCWPAGTVFTRINLDVEERSCPICDRAMYVCDHRYHHLWTLAGPTQVVNRLVRCPDPTCDSRGQTFSPEAELSISMPRWCMGWDVLCWLGHRRFARHWSVPQLRAELQDTYHIRLSDDALASYLGRYQTMLAARQQDPERLADDYREIASLVLTIDGLQPEKGHETLYVVRELRRKRVWFAEKQDAFVKAIGTEFPHTPHRYCQNHFLRDLAKPVLELDSQAKVKMRHKVRGLRTIERRVLEERRRTAALKPSPAPGPPQADETPRVAMLEVAAPEACARHDLGADQTVNACGTPAWVVTGAPDVEDEAGEVVLGYCAAVRGILNDDQGGPLHPPGVRMSEALQEVRESLDRNLDAQKGGVPRRC